MIYDDELILAEDYPMYLEYWYVVDGEAKRRTGAKEVRRCNAVERGFPLW